MTSTGNQGLDALADTIADRVWARIEERLKPEEQLISVTEAARRLSVSKSKLYQMLASGEVPARVVRKIGDRKMILPTELERWLRAQ